LPGVRAESHFILAEHGPSSLLSPSGWEKLPLPRASAMVQLRIIWYDNS